jgi:predicted KAP-like P-loop ATPase
MTEVHLPHSDTPITSPAEDRFGIDPFAKTLAAGIRRIKAPDGTVIALNGPWGSGKSSAVNLVLHHLKEAIEDNDKRFSALCVLSFSFAPRLGTRERQNEFGRN